MAFDGRAYSVLVVSSSDEFNNSIKPFLPESVFYPIAYASSIVSAKRQTIDASYDFVIINSPLRDDTGTRFAIDISKGSSVCLLAVRHDQCDEIYALTAPHGVFTIAKPIGSNMFAQALKWMAATRERLRSIDDKTVSIEEKMQEIRSVNRAKWLLIENLKMTEPDAHRYIEKQAMDRCVTRREVAETIIKTYK